jgi:hypothetical protein
VDWAWITGRIITATGWTFDQLNQSSFSDVADLLAYWAEEPPTHVILALRYLGAGKRSKQTSEAQTRKELGEMQSLPGMGPAGSASDHVKEMIRSAELLKQQHKGLS